MLPVYVESHRSGLLSGKIREARGHLEACDLCPRSCEANRLQGEYGVCQGGELPAVSSAAPHFGEEPPLVGWRGSGTIFFTHCNLRCCFCQNYDISHLGHGRAVSAGQLAAAMLQLQSLGCHNINFVTPTHFLPQILEAVDEAAARDLCIPLVWNCGGYESLEAMRLLEGVVDIYMPDIKFAGSGPAREFCDAPDYYERAKEAVREMHRQTGDLALSPSGIAERGLLVRHLVMPGDLAGSKEVIRFLAEEISKETYLNIMDQYRPCYRAREHQELNRGITGEEYRSVLEMARRAGLRRGFR